MPRFTLKYSEMAWWLIANEGGAFMNKRMLGNDRDIKAMRYGTEVLITSESIGCKDAIIPSGTTVQGFASDQNGKPLWRIMDQYTIYNCVLRPMYKSKGGD